MKKKISKIMGIGLAFVLLASLMTFAIPVSADPYDPLAPALPNMWTAFTPTPGGPPVDLWWYHPDISQDGPMAKAINGNLYIYVQNAPTGRGHFKLPDDTDQITITAGVGGDSGVIAQIGGPGTLTVAGTGTYTAATGAWSATVGQTIIVTATGDSVWCSWSRTTRTATAAITVDGDADAWFTYNDNILTSTDGGRTWAASIYPAFCTQAAAGAYNGGPVVDMVCSELYEDVCYATDGQYVYKTVNGGVTWAYVAPADLEYNLMGKCGLTVVSDGTTDGPITSIDVGYDGAGKPVVFIGTKYVGIAYDASHPDGTLPVVGSVYWIADETFPASWHDLQLRCYGCCMDAGNWPAGNPLGCYDVYAVGCAPDFTNSQKTYAVITTDDDQCTVPGGGVARTRVVYNTGTVCSWFDVSELAWDCVATNNFEIMHASRIMFPDYYSTNPTLFVGVVAWNGITTFTPGGDVYRVRDTVPAEALAIDLNVQGFVSGCVGIYHANICSLDYENDKLVAGAWDSYQLQSPTRVYYSGDGGWTWSPSLKDPTGTDHCYALFSSSVLAATRGCDCAVSLNCEAPEGAFFNQISLINMDIEQVLDLSHAPGYVIDSSIMYVLTYNSADSVCAPGSCTPDAFSLTCTADEPGAATVVETDATDKVNVTVLNEAAGTDITIAYVAATGTWTITLPDVDDAVLVSAIADNTNVTWTETDTTVVAAEVTDCDDDMTVAASGEDFDMPDGILAITSLLRWDGTYWERVHSSRSFFALGQYWVTSPLYDWVEVSPDFNETSCLYMANTTFDMTRSMDAGCSWAPLTYPCYDKPTISAWIVVDLETVLASAAVPTATGNLFKTTYHGSQPWGNYWVMSSAGAPAAAGVDFDLSPSIAADNSVLLGDAAGQVYLSQDVGETWAEIEDILETGATIFPAANTYVVFDPGYGTADDPGETMIYAAAGAVIGRCGLNFDALWVKQDWVRIDSTGDLISASGIDAEGDTALYVSDRGAAAGAVVDAEIAGTIAVSYPCDPDGLGEPFDTCTCDLVLDATGVTALDGAFELDEPVSIVEYNLACVDDATIAVTGSIVVYGLLSGALGTATVTLPDVGTCTPCLGTGTGIEVISSHLTVTTAGTAATGAIASGVVRSLNPMDLMPPAYPIPMVVFERLVNAAPLANPGTLEHPQADAFGVYPDDLWLTNASNVLWALDSDNPTTIWMWEDPLATPVIQIAPATGSVVATPTQATLEWNALDMGTMYEVMIFSFCATCPNNMELFGTFDVNPLFYCVDGVCCWVVTGLDPGTTYFWKVRVAEGSPYLSKWSELWTFSTELDQAVYCSPACGAEDISLTPNFSWYEVVGATGYEIEVSLTEDFATLLASGTPTINAWDGIPELEYGTTYYWRVRAVKDGIPSDWTYCLFSTMEEPTTPAAPITPVTIVTEEITPAWIWVIIGIGAALVIAVIVLIVTTRRVS